MAEKTILDLFGGKENFEKALALEKEAQGKGIEITDDFIYDFFRKVLEDREADYLEHLKDYVSKAKPKKGGVEEFKSIVDFLGGKEDFKTALEMEEEIQDEFGWELEDYVFYDAIEDAIKGGGVNYLNCLEDFVIAEVVESLEDELKYVGGVNGVSVNSSGYTIYVDVYTDAETKSDREAVVDGVVSIVDGYRRDFPWLDFSEGFNDLSPDEFVSQGIDDDNDPGYDSNCIGGFGFSWGF